MAVAVQYDIVDCGGGKWAVHDLWTGLPADVDGFAQIGLSLEDADDLADVLNHFHAKEYLIYPRDLLHHLGALE